MNAEKKFAINYGRMQNFETYSKSMLKKVKKCFKTANNWSSLNNDGDLENTGL